MTPDPGKSAGSADEFQKSPICCYLSYLRARGLSKIDPDPSLAPVQPRGGELGEGLGELRENLWELWQGAGVMRFEVQNCESAVLKYVSR